MNRKSGGFFLLDGLLASLLLGMGTLVALMGWQQAAGLGAWRQNREEAQELALEWLRGEHGTLEAGYRVEGGSAGRFRAARGAAAAGTAVLERPSGGLRGGL